MDGGRQALAYAITEYLIASEVSSYDEPSQNRLVLSSTLNLTISSFILQIPQKIYNHRRNSPEYS